MFFAIISLLIISLSSCKVQEVQVGDMRAFNIGELKKESVDLNFDIPINNNPALYYSLGISLCFEGMCSAIFHICPN